MYNGLVSWDVAKESLHTETDSPEKKIWRRENGIYIPTCDATITYYLFGQEATRIYHNQGIEELVNEKPEHSIFKFIEGITKSIEVIDAADGWTDYAVITEDEYLILEKLS